MKLSNSILPIALAGACALILSPWAKADELLLNGGFEDGSYSSTILSATNGSVPTDWTPNYGYDSESSYNHLATGNQYAGSYDLSIGNYDYQPLAELSQSFADVSGDSYTVTFYGYDGGAGGDSNAFLQVSVGAQSATFDDTYGSPYTEGTFTFTGTGSDTLTIAAQTNPSEWYVDDVSVSGTAAAASAPDQFSTIILFGFGLTLLGFVGKRFRGQTAEA